mmetsp:Transcript_73144/g.161428  ORF Transcript_73144/g.161428 Transcript_73144/m.161428 type:complete len:105 (+) Transcript_73144:136-450(+)
MLPLERSFCFFPTLLDGMGAQVLHTGLQLATAIFHCFEVQFGNFMAKAIWVYLSLFQLWPSGPFQAFGTTCQPMAMSPQPSLAWVCEIQTRPSKNVQPGWELRV